MSEPIFFVEMAGLKHGIIRLVEETKECLLLLHWFKLHVCKFWLVVATERLVIQVAVKRWNYNIHLPYISNLAEFVTEGEGAVLLPHLLFVDFFAFVGFAVVVEDICIFLIIYGPELSKALVALPRHFFVVIELYEEVIIYCEFLFDGPYNKYLLASAFLQE